jgi:hypothetical protein
MLRQFQQKVMTANVESRWRRAISTTQLAAVGISRISSGSFVASTLYMNLCNRVVRVYLNGNPV